MSAENNLVVLEVQKELKRIRQEAGEHHARISAALEMLNATLAAALPSVLQVAEALNAISATMTRDQGPPHRNPPTVQHLPMKFPPMPTFISTDLDAGTIDRDIARRLAPFFDDPVPAPLVDEDMLRELARLPADPPGDPEPDPDHDPYDGTPPDVLYGGLKR